MATGKKTGGRQKGTPNKVTALAKELITRWLELHNSRITPQDPLELIWQDFLQLDPRDRIKVSVEFIKLITPRTLEIDTAESTRRTIEDTLATLTQPGKSTK